MPLDRLPGGFYVPNRQDIIDQYLRDYRLRNPNASVGDGTLPFIEANALADLLLPVYADAEAVGNNTSLDDMTSEGIEQEAEDFGLPRRLPAVGGSGFVVVSASVGGGTIFAGDELRQDSTGYRYRVTETRLYLDGQTVPVEGIDVGPQTNLAAGTVLEWTSPRPGIGQRCKVFQAANGKGLQGGREEESNAGIANRIRDARRNPVGSGNAAEVRKLVTSTPGIPVEAVFVYPAVPMPGMTSWTFTLRPGDNGGTRAPAPVQLASAYAYVVGQLPGDDGHLACSIVEEPTDVSLKIAWDQNAAGWSDLVPWPLVTYNALVSSVTDALTFSVTTTSTAPEAGKTIAFFNSATGKFVKKRIASVTGMAPPYALTIDPSNAASDVSYVPTVNEPMCPWSDSLDELVQPVVDAFNALGPGEQVSNRFDEGLRLKRDPSSPGSWPYTLNNEDFAAVGRLQSVFDKAVAAPTLPYGTPNGTPGVSSRLLTLGKLMAFPF